MEGHTPFSVLDEKEVSIPYFSCISKWCHIKTFCRKLRKYRKYAFLGGVGLPNLLRYYIGGEGSLGTPNLYYVINGQPLIQRITGLSLKVHSTGLVFRLKTMR